MDNQNSLKRVSDNNLYGMVLLGGEMGWEARRELERRANRWLWLRKMFNRKAEPKDPLDFREELK